MDGKRVPGERQNKQVEKTRPQHSQLEANARHMLPDEPQIFVQVLRGHKAGGRNVVEAGLGQFFEHGVYNGQLPRDNGQVLFGVRGIQQECAPGQFQTVQIVRHTLQL